MKLLYSDFFGLVIGTTSQSDAQPEAGGSLSVHVGPVQDYHDDLVWRRPGLFQTLIGIFQQLLQFLQSLVKHLLIKLFLIRFFWMIRMIS